MTAKKDLKRRVRARQAQTGESYAAARSKVVAAVAGAAKAEAVAEAEPPVSETAIPFEELLDLSPDAERLGIKCRVGMSSRLAGRIDPGKTLERIRDALLATEDDPATTTLRAVILRGEPPIVPARAPIHWVRDTRRFVVRARAGIGGVSDHGNMLALHVDGLAGGAVLVICHVWIRPFGMRPDQAPPRLMLSSAEALGNEPATMFTLLR